MSRKQRDEKAPRMTLTLSEFLDLRIGTPFFIAKDGIWHSCTRTMRDAAMGTWMRSRGTSKWIADHDMPLHEYGKTWFAQTTVSI